MGIPTPFQNPGPHMTSGLALNQAIAAGAASYTDAITAFSTGGQTSAVPLRTRINHVTVVAADNDSVMMPTSSPGAIVIIVNNGAHSLQVFANLVSALQSGVEDTLNGTPGATGVAVGAGKTAIFMCFAAGAYVGPVALA